jgi:hypothetical protein
MAVASPKQEVQGLAQVIRRLLSKRWALHPNPSAAKKKSKRELEREHIHALYHRTTPPGFLPNIKGIL